MKTHKWTTEDYYEMLGAGSNKAIAKKIKRTELAVGIKRGEIFTQFMAWAQKKGYISFPEHKHIEEFLKEMT